MSTPTLRARRAGGAHRTTRRREAAGPPGTDVNRYARADLLRGTPLPTGAVPWLAPLAVALLALALRAYELGRPDEIIFDETYYAPEAQDLLSYGVEVDTDDSGEVGAAYVVHPPLGKWLIALGIRAVGYSPTGWRVSAVVAGTLIVWLTCRAGARLTRSTALGCAAGLLVAVDALSIVQSRVAMLDVFLALFVLASFACLLVDRDRVRARLAERLERGEDVAGGRRGVPLGARPWLVAAGVMAGGALGVKWTGVYWLLAAGLLALAFEAGARRSAGTRRPLLATAARLALPGAAALLVVPLAVYLASWTGWFLAGVGWDRDWAASNPGGLPLVPDALRSLWHYHAQMYGFHTGLSTPHRYESAPWGWLLLARPVAYAFDGDVSGCGAESCAEAVLAVGNPALFWVSIPALVLLVWRWVTRRDPRAAALLVPVGLLLLPWGWFDVRDDRTMFLFYVLPAVPFLAMAVALVAGWLVSGAMARGTWAGRVALGVFVGYLATAVILLVGVPGVPGVGLYPVLTGELLTRADWSARLWFPSWI